jgi:macrolide transport system ATP-binding/permease protein
MTICYRILAYVRWLFRRREFEQALEQDLSDYIERSAADKMRDGVPADQALRAARLELGGVEQTKDRVRARLVFGPLEAVIGDVRYALRAMRSEKAFTALAVMCLALGIGANTTIFSFMEATLFRSLPVSDPGSLVVLRWSAQAPRPAGPDGPAIPWSVRMLRGALTSQDGLVRGDVWPYPLFEWLEEQDNPLSGVFGRQPIDDLVIDDGTLASATFVTGGYFESLGIRPQAGRALTDDDDRFDASPAVVLTAAFSRARFRDDEAALGEVIRINGAEFTVVGVLPPEFFGLDPTRSPDLFFPMRSGPLIDAMWSNTPDMYRDTGGHWISVWGRLRPGVDRAQAEAVLGPQLERYEADTAVSSDALRNLPSLRVEAGGAGLDGLRARYREPLLVLFTMVALILAVACASLASLLLARTTGRRREMAVRLSLGARPLGLVRQLLTESVLLASVGGLAGVGLSVGGMRILSALLADGDAALTFRPELDAGVLAFTAGLSLVTGLIFGVVPALRATRVDPFPALKTSGSSSTDDAPRGAFRVGIGQIFVVTQVALALVLIFGASLFGATLSNLRSTELGFNKEDLLLASVDASRIVAHEEAPASPERIALDTFYATLRARLSRLPGVSNVTLSWSVLAGGGPFVRSVAMPGLPGSNTDVNVQIIGERFFETLEIPLLGGRSIDAQDVTARRAVAVVDERFAETYFPDLDPIGRTVEVNGEGELSIVGVAANARHDVVRGDVRPVVYFSYTWDPHAPPAMVYEMRVADDPLGYADTFRRIVRELDPDVIVTSVYTQDDGIDRTIRQEIAFAGLSNAFALLALLIACIGLYGTVSYNIARRAPEMGIRMALGATRSGVLNLVIRQALGLGVAGVLVGLPAALLAARFIEGFLWGIEPYDPTAVAVASAAVLAAVALAGYAPANRASRIDPMQALRTE